MVPHRSTNQARTCLTSLSGREAVLSCWYGRSRFSTTFHATINKPRRSSSGSNQPISAAEEQHKGSFWSNYKQKQAILAAQMQQQAVFAAPMQLQVQRNSQSNITSRLTGPNEVTERQKAGLVLLTSPANGLGKRILSAGWAKN